MGQATHVNSATPVTKEPSAAFAPISVKCTFNVTVPPPGLKYGTGTEPPGGMIVVENVSGVGGPSGSATQNGAPGVVVLVTSALSTWARYDVSFCTLVGLGGQARAT